MSIELWKAAADKAVELIAKHRVTLYKPDDPSRPRPWCWEDREEGETPQAHLSRLQQSRDLSMIFMRFMGVGGIFLVAIMA